MGIVKYSTVEIPAVESVEMTFLQQDPPPVRQGYSNRADRQGVRQHWIASKHKGMGAITGSELSQDDLLRYRYNAGLWVHRQGGCTLPPVVTTQASLVATDISGTRALNLRAFQVNSTLGQSKLRPYIGFNVNVLRSTSDSNPAMADSGYAFTNGITGMFESRVNNTRYLIVCTGGTTDDVFGFADPTLSPPARTEILSVITDDHIGGESFPGIGSGHNVWFGRINGVQGFFETKFSDALLTTPRALVSATNAHVPNPANASVTLAAKSTQQIYQDLTAAGLSWANTANVRASDNSYSTATLNAAGELGGAPIYFSGFGFNIPTGSIILGIQMTAEVSVSTDGANGWTTRPMFTTVGATPGDVRVVKAGAIVAASAKTDATGFTTSDASITFGSTSDTWTSVSAEDMNDDGFGFVARIAWNKAINADSAAVRIDHVSCTVTYLPPGSAINASSSSGSIMGIGGHGLVDPFTPNTMWIRAPVADELFAITVPRALYKLELTYDSDGDRPVGTLTKVYTSLSHVEVAGIGAGAIVVAGDTSSGIAKSMKLVRNDGTVLDTGFGSVGQGFTENWGIVNVYAADRVIIAQCALEAETILQDWLFFDGTWNPIGPRVSITKFPLAYGNIAQVDPTQRRRYTIRPTTTATMVDRTFQPRSMFLNPIYTDTAEVKENGVITIQLPDMDLLGPVESNKSLLTAWCFSRDVSSTNTIRLRYSTDGASTFTTWATFTAYGSKSALSTPVNFRSCVLEIGLDHTAGGAGTPNGFPILIEGIAKWRALRQWIVIFNPGHVEVYNQYEGGPDALFAALQTVVNSNPANTLWIDDSSFLASWDDFNAKGKPGAEVGTILEWDGKGRLMFSEVAS